MASGTTPATPTSRPGRDPEWGWRSALAFAGLGVLLTVGASELAHRREAERDQSQFDQRSSVLAGAVTRSFQMAREVVLALPPFFEASERVEAQEFRKFVQPALSRHPSLATIEWAPFVRDAQRAEFEDKLRVEGLVGFEIREPGEDGKLVRSPQRPQYLPLVFIEPSPRENARGFELLHDPLRRLALETAIDQGSLHVSHRLDESDKAEDSGVVAVYAPGYDPNQPRQTVAERRSAFLGVVVARFHLRPLIEGALSKELREGISLAVIDGSAPKGQRVLYETEAGTASRGSGDSEMTHREGFVFGNRRYSVLTVGRRSSPWSPWLVLGVGLALTTVAFGAQVLLNTIRRLREKVEESVRLGQYTLEEKIGEGGMGVVYRATHALLRRPAAVKLLVKQTNESDLLRFEREVQLTSQLAHPNTISIFDYGRTADGAFYYVMEFLDGMDLDRLVREDGPLPAPRAIHVLTQVCGALAEAHLMGLIHRDIKPANIVLTERADEPDVVKVVDFGLAKTIVPAPGEADITRVNTITGTPLYLAPEAISSPPRVDARSDIYALGAVAYFILTGQHVFTGKSTVEVLTKHLLEQPRPPAEWLERPLSPDLERLILACLAKDPSARPSTAAALREALLACKDAADYDPSSTREWWRTQGARLKTSTRLGLEPTLQVSRMAIDFHSRTMPDSPRSRP